MQIKSLAFENGGEIPNKYTCDGEKISPPLIFYNVPKKAKSLALVMDDPDIPEIAKQNYDIEVWDHWVMRNISPEIKEIIEGSVPSEAIVGRGTRGVNNYTPPCPPDREHRYFFELYALDIKLNIDKNSTRADLEKAMKGHILDQAELIGRYKRI